MRYLNQQKIIVKSNYCIAQTSCPSSDVATKLAHHCIENKLAACVQIIPAVQSIYQWQGKIEQEIESLLVMKTIYGKLPQLEAFILQNHPYDVPEFITLNIQSGSSQYLDWIMQSLK